MFLEPGLLAALSEGQRTLAHLVILLALPVVAGLVLLIRREVRRRNETRETQRTPEEH